ncbi:MAG: hypothetical protein JJE21_06980 [Spirochaetaceae bacterium]|nr:hypothetical protein [Spirochaetaceae bacterium]
MIRLKIIKKLNKRQLPKVIVNDKLSNPFVVIASTIDTIILFINYNLYNNK